MATYHHHLGYACVAIRLCLSAYLAKGPYCGITARDAAIHVEPFAVQKSVVGLKFSSLHIVELPEVGFSAASLVGVVGTYFTIAPVRHRKQMGIVGVGIACAECGISSADKQVYCLGVVHVTFGE